MALDFRSRFRPDPDSLPAAPDFYSSLCTYGELENATFAEVCAPTVSTFFKILSQDLEKNEDLEISAPFKEVEWAVVVGFAGSELFNIIAGNSGPYKRQDPDSGS